MGFVATIFRFIICLLKLLVGAANPSDSIKLLTSDDYMIANANELLLTTEEG